MKFIFLIVGQSGSGKTTIIDALKRKRPNLKSVESYTTRPRRFEGETGHTFVTKDEFKNLEKSMCAYTMFNDYEYCATHQQIDDADLYTIDPDGIEYFLKEYKGDKKPVVIYIKASSITRFCRMVCRGDGWKKSWERIKHDSKVFSKKPKVLSFAIYNTDLERAIEELDVLISALSR